MRQPPRRTAGSLLLRRRDFLRASGAVIALSALPPLAIGCGDDDGGGSSTPPFLTDEEFETLAAVCDRILPPDADPGAAELGAAAYIDRLLAAFDGPGVPFIYAGGPTSDRNPFPNRDGAPSRNFPANEFIRFVPLSRLQELRWRAELFGTAATPGADVNDAVLGPMRGLREIYRDGLAHIDAAANERGGERFAELDSAAQDEILDALEPTFPLEPRRGGTFYDILIQHTLEGCFALPEYGGNHAGQGWAMLGLEGDVHPLGFSVFASAGDDYRERPEHPMSTANPDELAADGTLRPRALTADGERIQTTIFMFASLLPVD